jgi:hypothetical protein
MAIDGIRHRRRIFDVGTAKESCASSLLALAGSFREIPDSFFFAGRHWERPAVVTPLD